MIICYKLIRPLLIAPSCVECTASTLNAPPRQLHLPSSIAPAVVESHMRAVLSRTNKAKLQQQKRDDKKRKQTEPVAPPAEVLTSTHSSKKRGVNKIVSEEQDAKEQPIELIPGYRGPMKVATIVCMLDLFLLSLSLSLSRSILVLCYSASLWRLFSSVHS